MMTCGSCGKEAPGEFPFCPFCRAPLTAFPASVAQERKVVSVLFCDLVGFTAASESADPEEVAARVAPYHTAVRERIEAFGGTVEKFIGDAVMALFGAPVAHEDDAERAVRAGLAVLEVLEGLNAADGSLELSVRVGVNTGEAVVSLGARPELGEGMVTGDVVNTAARIQAQAPVDGVAVGEGTFRTTERAFEWEQLEPISAKGKSEPLSLWRALRPTARFGSDVIRSMTNPLVGRELEMLQVRTVLDRVVAESSVQLVTVVGEPGVGKSRLVAELHAYSDGLDRLVTWRQGRCLPYGDGITFWPLGEVVKAHAGIYESDSPEVATEKLDAVLPESDDRPWLRARLLPLLGVEAGQAAGQEELFTAWRRFLESVAEDGPFVIVVEDIHWADEPMLAFLEHLADWAQGVPLLIVCTTRPELYEAHHGWGGGLANATPIRLSPLSDTDTARLVSVLLEQAALPAETQHMLLERAGGNPLYAEEFVRMLHDRGLLDERGTLRADAEVPVPESIQALIAARQDTLKLDRKSLLQDAAVLGKVFWSGAVAGMAGRDLREVDVALHELARIELVRPVRASSMEGEQEYSFWHALVRDVCYAQIPRAERASRHRAAAVWIEGKSPGRVEDSADLLAYHYLRALELTRAIGQTDGTDELEAAARRHLGLAGTRALALDVASAEASLALALSFAPVGHPDRALLLERWAHAAHQQGRLQEARSATEEAIALYRGQNEQVAAGRALTALVTTLWALGDPRRKDVMSEAITVLEGQPAGPELVAAYAELAGVHFVSTLFPEAISAANQALHLASVFALPEPARALGFRGGARCYLGELEGLDDMRRALDLSLEQGQSRMAAVSHANLAIAIGHYQGPGLALAQSREGIDFCERRGIAEFTLAIAVQRLAFLFECGRAAEALAEAELLADQAEASGYTPNMVQARSVQLRLLAQRGEGAQAVAAAEQLAVTARRTGVPEAAVVGFAGAAQLLLVQGLPGQARDLLVELVNVPAVGDDPYFGSLLPELVRCALALEDPALVARLAASLALRTPLAERSAATVRAALSETTDPAGAASLYTDAAERWQEFGNLPELAHALLGQGRCLTTLDDPEAGQPLRQARTLFEQMFARPRAEECNALLAQATRLSS